MAMRAVRVTAYAALPALYLLHNDLWLWDDPGRFLGLPVGLTYHVLFTAAVVLAMWRLVRVAWPGDTLDGLAGAGGNGAGQPGVTHDGGADGRGAPGVADDGGAGQPASAGTARPEGAE